MDIKRITNTTSTKRIEIRLDADWIVTILRDAGVDVPATANVYIEVPGGGDWSNTNLDVDKDAPVVVSWSETTHDRSDD